MNSRLWQWVPMSLFLNTWHLYDWTLVRSSSQDEIRCVPERAQEWPACSEHPVPISFDWAHKNYSCTLNLSKSFLQLQNHILTMTMMTISHYGYFKEEKTKAQEVPKSRNAKWNSCCIPNTLMAEVAPGTERRLRLCAIHVLLSVEVNLPLACRVGINIS